jgi:hypothetical protein
VLDETVLEPEEAELLTDDEEELPVLWLPVEAVEEELYEEVL